MRESANSDFAIGFLVKFWYKRVEKIKELLCFVPEYEAKVKKGFFDEIWWSAFWRGSCGWAYFTSDCETVFTVRLRILRRILLP